MAAPPPLTPDLLATYRKNILRITDPDDIDQMLLEVRVGDNGDVPLPDVHVIPAWNPGGVPTSVGQNVAGEPERIEAVGRVVARIHHDIDGPGAAAHFRSANRLTCPHSR